MLIRPARESDFETITAITNQVIATSAIHFGYDPVTVADLVALWRPGMYPWLVADDNGRVAGYAKAGQWRERAAYRWTCETTIYLADGERGRGLGRTLYTALLDALPALGFHSAIGGITLPNPASVALHTKLGFTSVGVVREAGKKFDAWHDVEFFQKLLTSAAS
jgi:phosphinothricin acetyltransferase